MLGISEVLSLELKKTDALDLYKPLSSFITKQYGNHVAKEYEGALQGIQQKRTELRNLQEKSEGSRDLCLKYAADLAFIDKHFPVNSGADRIAMTFSWYDLFSRKKVSQGNIFYEQANVLFCAATLESQIATAENRNSDEGQKNATKAFQNAAGIFTYIKEKVANKIVERITNDMTPESLECLSLLMLANAQQCVVEKADKGKMKPGILAKLAASASGMFGQAAKIMSANSEVLDRTWRDYANFKALYFEAVAHFYLSVEHYAADEMGNTLSRIKKGYALMEEAKKYKTSKALQTSAKNFVDELNKKEQVAEHENQKIYHERVPDVSTLPAIEKRDLAKITQIDDITTYIKATDAFERLYPVRVMEAKQRYTENLNSKLQIAFRTAREHRDKVKAGLAQMGLPGSIMAVEQKVGFPEQVHERIQKINQSGGMSRITDLKTILEEMSTATYDSCNKLKKLMEEEQQDDEKCRQQFGSRWNRHASSTLTVNLKKQLDDFISKVSIARKSDDLINQKIKQHSNYFTRFTLDRSELDKIMPTPDLSNVNETLGKSYNDLKQALSQLDQCFAQEDSIENEVKQVQTQENIEPALLENQDNLEAAIQQELNKYELKFKELAQLGQDEENIMQTVVQANQLFVQHKSSSKSIERREAVIQEMYAALNKYDEVLANIKEGIQFYTSMQDILKKHQQRIEDFVFARRTEKQDLITNIQTQVSGIQAQQQQQQQYQAPPQYQPHAQQQNYYMPPQYQQLPPTPNQQQQQQQYPVYQGGYQQQQPPQYQQRPLPPTPQYQPYPPQ